MNVLIVVPWDQAHGGVASVVANLAKHLRDRGHGVFFFHPSRTALIASTGETRLGFPGFRMRLALPFTAEHPVLSTVAFCLLLPLLLTQLLVFIRRHNIQLVNLHYPMASFLLFAICCRVASIKLVTSIHGADIFPRGRRREKYHIGLRYLLRSSDLIVANSRAFREDFLAVFPQLDKKTTAIHNGVNAEEFYGCDRLQPGKYGRYVLCIAAHNEKKALDVLLRAFVEITAVDKDLKLILVGDGPLRPQLQDLAASLHLNGQVRFVGAQGREEVARLLHGCEIFVLPSRSEPFGIAVIEAMLCRKPVVAAASGGIPEIIEDGRSGILVKPDDPPQLAAAMKRLLDNQDFQRTIGENGYTRAIGHFLAEENGRAYEEAFERLVEPLTT